MKEIRLTNGMITLIDDPDYELVSKYNWRFLKKERENTGYAVTTIQKPGTKNNNNRILLYLHRLIMNPVKTQMVDHRNGNGLDNTRSNLRFATHRQNSINSRKPRTSKSTSKYKGVSYAGLTLNPNCRFFKKPWYAQIMVNKVKIKLGRFETEEHAYRAYCEAANKYFGEFARLE